MRKQIRNVFFPTKQIDGIFGRPTWSPIIQKLALYPYEKEFKWDDRIKYKSDIDVKDFYEKYFSTPEDFIKLQNTDIWDYFRRGDLIKQLMSAIKFTLNYKDSKEYKNMEKYWKDAYDEANSIKLIDIYIDFLKDRYKKFKDKGYNFKSHEQKYKFLDYSFDYKIYV